MTRPNVLGPVALGLLLSMAVPLGSAQTPGIDNPTDATPTTLYMHLIDFQDFPINTQKPDDNWTQSTNVGAFSSTGTCFEEQYGNTAGLGTSFHTFYGYSSPSYVEYDRLVGGKPVLHPERGISYDALIDDEAGFTLYWYLSAMSVAAGVGAADPDLVPVPIPNVVVSAAIRTGDLISIDDRNYNTGPLLVGGSTEPTLLFGPTATGPDGEASPTIKPLGQVGEEWLYEIALPMKVHQPLIPRNGAYNLRIDIAMDNPACTEGPDKTIMPNLVRIHSSPTHRPRMEFSVFEPIRLEYIHPQFVGDELVVHTSMNSVWGNYDVAELSPYTPDVPPEWLSISISGPSTPQTLQRAAFVQRTEVHYHHQEAVDISYVWPYKAERAAPGLYTVEVSFRNDQGQAEAKGLVTFEVGKDQRPGDIDGCGAVVESSQDTDTTCLSEEAPPTQPAQPTPGLGLAASVAALAALAIALRRRSA